VTEQEEEAAAAAKDHARKARGGPHWADPDGHASGYKKIYVLLTIRAGPCIRVGWALCIRVDGQPNA
jgi:hypothetical protein